MAAKLGQLKIFKTHRRFESECNIVGTLNDLRSFHQNAESANDPFFAFLTQSFGQHGFVQTLVLKTLVEELN